MLNNESSYKYETLSMVPCVITQISNNVTATLKMGSTTIRYNICQINPYYNEVDVDDVHL